MDYFNQETLRLRFRKLTREDIPQWTHFFIDNDRLPYLGIDLSKNARTHATEWVEMQSTRYKEQGLGHLAVETKADNAFIGVGGIIPRLLHEKTEYEIAYSLLPAFWKRGYATEIAQHMKRYGLKNISTPRLVSIIDKRNTDSIKVAQKNDMTILFETIYLGMDVWVYGIEKTST